MGVVLINSLNEFNGILHANKNVVVDIFASWCGPCKVIKPKFVQLEQKYSKFITFCSVDIDNVNDFAEEYRVNVLPTFLFFNNSELFDKLEGANYDKLVNILSKMTNI